jgi:hypothetical protein
MLPGDHFFVHSAESMLLQILALELKAVLSGLNHHRDRTKLPYHTAPNAAITI